MRNASGTHAVAFEFSWMIVHSLSMPSQLKLSGAGSGEGHVSDFNTAAVTSAQAPKIRPHRVKRSFTQLPRLPPPAWYTPCQGQVLDSHPTPLTSPSHHRLPAWVTPMGILWQWGFRTQVSLKIKRKCLNLSTVCVTLGMLSLQVGPHLRRWILFTFSIQTNIDLPMIAVIRNQSAGKSSLIESISGITLPRSAGTCTVTISFLSHVFFLISVVWHPYFSFTPSYKETDLYLLAFPDYSFPLLFPL